MAPTDTGLTYRALALALRPPVTLIARRDWAGAEHLPPPGVGCIVAANHLSAFDPLVVAHFLLDFFAFVGYSLIAPYVSWL